MTNFEQYFAQTALGHELIRITSEDFAFRKGSKGQYLDCVVQSHYETWQASANRADFVLVLIEPKKDTIIKIACVCIGNSFANFDEAKELYKAMIEAVPKEQSND